MRIPLPNPFARLHRSDAPAPAPRPPSPPRPIEPPHPAAAESSHSAYPPRLQQMRHIRALLNSEKGHMAAAKPGSEARRLHGKFVGYLERYEQVLDHQGSWAIRHAEDQVDLAHRNGRTDLARLQAALSPPSS